MTINRRNICILTVCTILLVLVPPSIFLQAKAEPSVIADGHYQVELNFSPAEGFQEPLFKKIATLAVENGHYQLTVALEQQYAVSDIHIEQLGNAISFTFDKIENLVQLDGFSLDQPIVIKGNIELSTEEPYTLFSQELEMNPQTLPQIEIGVIGQEWEVDYILLVDGKNEPSIMNTYVDPVAKIIEKDGSYYAHITILQAAWVTGLKIDKQGQQMEPKLISLVDNTRVIEFEIEDLTQPVRMWVKIDIPDISYHHQYFVQLAFEQAQIGAIINQPIENKVTQPVIHEEPAIIVIEEPTVIVQNVAPKASTSVLPEKTIDQSPISTIPAAPFTAPLIPQEEPLAFDRTLDESTVQGAEEQEEAQQKDENTTKKPVNQPVADSTMAPLNIAKIVLLVFLCVLSGWLLIRRMKNAKKIKADQ
ncbi:NEAT domain-containing protein [Lysinibacillus sp. FSL H8-0500]|uniref:NEAT domain-containing protein n=1 Tax=Lysinibacillus sp. FSL H8-0500 TaxID=2921393 RepID=UPI0031019D16